MPFDEPLHKTYLRTGLTRREACWMLAGVCGAAFSSSIAAQADSQSAPDLAHPAVSITLQDIRLERLLSDRAELSASLEITPASAVTLQRLRCNGLCLRGDTPLYMEPLLGRFSLQSGVPYALPRATLSAYYSDFPSPEAMDTMLAAHRVRVTGEVRADLQLTLLGRLAIRDRNPIAALPLDQTVAIAEDAVDTPTQLGISVLSLAGKALGLTASVVDRVAGVRVVVRPDPAVLRSRDSMAYVQTTYRLTGRGGAFEKSCVRLGFWVDATQLLVPAEILEPWTYALGTAAMLASGAVQLDRTSIETTVFPCTAGVQSSSWSRKRGDFQVGQAGQPPTSRLLLPGGGSVSLRERESTQNFALLQFPAATGLPLRSASTDAAERTLSLLRWSRPEGARGLPDNTELTVLPLGSERLQVGVHLPRPVDERAFGSPLLADNGVVGMVVGERTVVPLGDILPATKRTSSPDPSPVAGVGMLSNASIASSLQLGSDA